MTYLNTVLIRSALEELSSSEIHQKLWEGHLPGQMSSYSEVIENLFSDSGLSVALEEKNRFSDRCESKLLELSKAVAEFNGLRSPTAIIADPKFDSIRILSGEILREFDDCFSLKLL